LARGHPGGRFHAEWDEQAPVTREGQLIFFFQFLHAGGRWEEFLRDCPLHYTGNRGSGALNVMGTALLSVLCGHWRYAHINAVRGDGINPGLLGMTAPSARTPCAWASAASTRNPGLDWLSDQILGSISPALGLPWILDIDVTVKPLYGRQQGAEIGYNPQKPGRPSHVYHSYFVANLRISLGVEVRPGNEHAAAKGLPGLWRTLEKLPRHQWPTFTRGDCGYGSEATMLEHEERGLPYLFKLRHTAKVKDLVMRMMRQGAPGRTAATAGRRLKPPSASAAGPRSGASSSCAKPRPRPCREARRAPPRQRPSKPPAPRQRSRLGRLQATPWSGKIAVLVTSSTDEAFPTAVMPRHYRDRADAENCFDELKNQWGWNGYTSRRLAPAGSWPTSSPCFTTGGTSICASMTKSTTAKPSAAAPCSCPEWADRSKAVGVAPSKSASCTKRRPHRPRRHAHQQRVASHPRHHGAMERGATLDAAADPFARRWLGGKWLPGLPDDADSCSADEKFWLAGRFTPSMGTRSTESSRISPKPRSLKTLE
jgi:hypothetical protein